MDIKICPVAVKSSARPVYSRGWPLSGDGLEQADNVAPGLAVADVAGVMARGVDDEAGPRIWPMTRGIAVCYRSIQVVIWPD